MLIYYLNVLNNCLIICFRPAGWDSMKKISILSDNMQTIKSNDFYNSVITNENTKKVCLKYKCKQPKYIYIYLLIKKKKKMLKCSK